MVRRRGEGGGHTLLDSLGLVSLALLLHGVVASFFWHVGLLSCRTPTDGLGCEACKEGIAADGQKCAGWNVTSCIGLLSEM